MLGSRDRAPHDDRWAAPELPSIETIPYLPFTSGTFVLAHASLRLGYLSKTSAPTKLRTRPANRPVQKPVQDVRRSELRLSPRFRLQASRPIWVSMRESRRGCARPDTRGAPRATACSSISTGVCLLVLGAILAGTITALPSWSQSLIASFIVALAIGWLARWATTPTGPIRFEPTGSSASRPRDVSLCRRHRMGFAKSHGHCGTDPGDSVSPWFQLW
jgi:hypothetical protein